MRSCSFNVHRPTSRLRNKRSPARWRLRVGSRQAFFELRAAVGLARLYRSQHRFGPARDSLGPVRATWGENLDIPEVQEGERVLRSLDSAN